MADAVFPAIHCEALHAKSKVYVSRALARKAERNLDEYQLWASLALELLGKAALAGRHPCLVVDPTHWQSLFVAAGVNVTTDVKTITAKTLFERLAHLVPRFDKTVQRFCQEIAERRNAELHSGDLPFRTMRLEVWEARYWHACETILHSLSSSLENWLGAEDAEAPRVLLEEAAAAHTAAVKLRVEAAATRYAELKKVDRERLQRDAGLREPSQQQDIFRADYDEIWAEQCPACSCKAFMAGTQTGEDITEEHDQDAIWEVVEREFEGEEFRCPTCDLTLVGSDEIVDGGLVYVHTDEQARELEYEPDYGND